MHFDSGTFVLDKFENILDGLKSLNCDWFSSLVGEKKSRWAFCPPTLQIEQTESHFAFVAA